MSIADRSPAPNAQIETGDLFSCEITHTGASAVTVTVDGELAWSLAGGGQAGFTISKATLSEVTTISVSRDAGWAGSPIVVEVDITAGAEAGTTSWSYYVGTQTAYPPGTQPYHDTLETGINVLKGGVLTVEDLSKLDIDSATMNIVKTAEGRAKLFGSPSADNIPSFWNWAYETGGGVPSNGKFTADSDSIASITSISLDDTSGAGPIITGPGVNIKVGDYIALKSGDAALHATYKVTSAANNLGYWTYGVLFSNGVGPTLTDTNSYEFGFLSAFGPHGFGEWEFDSTTTKADPTAGKFRLNNFITQGSATEMYISQEDSSGATLDNALNSLQSGDTIRLQSRTQARVQVYTVDGTVVDEGVYKTVPIAHVSAGSSDLIDTDECSLYILRAVATSAQASIARVTFASGGGTPGTAEVTTNTTNWTAVATIKVHERDLDTNNIMTPFFDRLRVGDHIGLRERSPGGFGSSTVGNFLIDGISYAANVYTFTVTPYPNNGGTPLDGDIYEVVLGFTKDSGGGTGAGMDQKAYVSGGGAPAAGKMTANADALSSVTTLNLSDSSGVDNNFSIAYGAIQPGDFIVLRDNAGGAAHGTFEVVSSVDNTTYWTFTVTFKNVAGSFVATNDYDIWVLSAGGSGDVVGPASATNGAITLFDGTTGKLVKDLGATFTAASGGKFAVGMTNAYMRMKEKATAAASTAGQGDWWVKNDVPSAPKFTGDDGTDYYLLRSAAQPGNGRIQMGTTTGSIDDEAVFNYGTGSLNMTNAAGSRIRMKEAATKVATPLAGEGLWWVRSDTPNVPMFTDDAGTDFVLNASGSGDVSGGAASVANEIPTYGDTSGKLIGRSDILISSSTPTVGTRTLGANSVLAGGRIGTAGTITASGDGSIALGYATLTGGGTSAALSSTGAGSIVIGTALSNGASGNAKVEATNLGSIAMGYCNDTTGTSRISSLALGSMATGRAQLGSIIETTSFGAGGFSQGYATGGGIIRVSNEGALARGYSNGAGTTIISSGDGSLASGYASASGGLLASGNGAVAMGHGFGAAITASGEGSIAVGYGLFQAVTASGAGSGAFGQASGAAIVASAANSYQFGVGTNAQATSLQVGDTTDGVRLTGGGAPTTPHDGDIWVDASGDVNISSSGGGATAVVFNLPAITGSRGGNAALADLLTKLAAMNLITDSTT